MENLKEGDEGGGGDGGRKLSGNSMAIPGLTNDGLSAGTDGRRRISTCSGYSTATGNKT